MELASHEQAMALGYFIICLIATLMSDEMEDGFFIALMQCLVITPFFMTYDNAFAQGTPPKREEEEDEFKYY